MISAPALLAYSGQVFILIATALLAIKTLKIRNPRLRLLLLQFVWGACLLLPWLQKAIGAPDKRSQITVMIGRFHAVGSRSVLDIHLPERLLVLLLLGGALLSLCHFVRGLGRLRNLRQRATLVAPPMRSGFRRVSVYASSEIAGPATYGLFHPVILLPGHLQNNDAVLRHELLHVARCDWICHFAEQLTRRVLWFHPAVWRLVAEIDLAREQAVDAEAVAAGLAGDVRKYVDALIDVAAWQAERNSVLAPAFGRRSSLRRRIEMLIQRPEESRRKLVFSTAVFTTCLALAGWQSARAFPFSSTDHQKEENAKQENAPREPIRVPGETEDKAAIKKVVPVYPKEAKAAGIEGSVKLDVTISKEGHVESVKPISGPAELMQSAVDAVRQWEFRPVLLNGEPVEVVSDVLMNYTLRR
jgi:TonB family protein